MVTCNSLSSRIYCSMSCLMMQNGVRQLWSTSEKIYTILEPEKQLHFLKRIKKAIKNKFNNNATP